MAAARAARFAPRLVAEPAVELELGFEAAIAAAIAPALDDC